MNRLAIFIFALALSSCSAGSGHRNVSSIVQSDKASMASLAYELQQEHKAGTFDGLVLVAQGDVALFKSAYGYADREDSVRNSSAAIFDMGSIAKTFTAAAVLQLALKEKLQLSETIGDFYPTASDEIKPITITQLLGHSSGLDNFHNESDFELIKINKTQWILCCGSR